MREGWDVRRGRGDLERAVLQIVWQASEPLSPGEVLERLGDTSAYTTVMTVLTRLHDKGMLARDRVGKAYRYRPALSEAEFTAERMGSDLHGAAAPAEVLSHFVARLSADEADALRRLLRRNGR